MRRDPLSLAKTACLASALALAACAAPRPGTPPSTAANPGCPPWVNFPTDIHSNEDSPYLGCTVQQNLERQVERPSDLAAGRALGPGNGTRESGAVDTYQQGKIPPFSTDSVAGPTIVLPGGASGSP